MSEPEYLPGQTQERVQGLFVSQGQINAAFETGELTAAEASEETIRLRKREHIWTMVLFIVLIAPLLIGFGVFVAEVFTRF